jgi:hypothetical protein
VALAQNLEQQTLLRLGRFPGGHAGVSRIQGITMDFLTFALVVILLFAVFGIFNLDDL